MKTQRKTVPTLTVRVVVDGTAYVATKTGPEEGLVPGARKFRTIKGFPRNGAVTLMHNAYHDTRDDARRVASELKRQGYVAQAIVRETGKSA